MDWIWAAQDGKHEIIVKNIHDMLVKLAWDPEQLDYLFGCFQVCEHASCVNTPGESGPLIIVHITVVSGCINRASLPVWGTCIMLIRAHQS